MRRRAQGTRGRSRKRPVGGRSRPCNAGTAVTYVPLESEGDRQTRLSASRQRLQVQQVHVTNTRAYTTIGDLLPS